MIFEMFMLNEYSILDKSSINQEVTLVSKAQSVNHDSSNQLKSVLVFAQFRERAANFRMMSQNKQS